MVIGILKSGYLFHAFNVVYLLICIINKKSKLLYGKYITYHLCMK